MTDQFPPAEAAGARMRVLWLSTVAFTILFAVWLMLGILGLKIKEDPGLILGDAAAGLSADEAKKLTETRFEWLLASAILAGSLLRLNFGIWADRYGGRNVIAGLLLFTAVPTYALSQAQSYPQLVACALLFGLAGNSFTVGVSWNSAWFPAARKGTALGVFGAGNVGASGTKLLVVLLPGVLTLVPAAGYLGGLIPGGWRAIPAAYSVLLVLTGLAVLALAPAPDRRPGRGRPTAEMLAPLRHLRAWRLSTYYVVVFGAYVALSSWLPNYYRNTYDLPVRTAALLTALFIFPASLLRPLGGYLSDVYGPRVVTYVVFIGMAAALVPLALLPLGPTAFTILMVAVGVGMGIGKASVYKYIPNYYPNDVGAVGGVVGMFGALGGFMLPPAFGAVSRAAGTPQAAFLALLALTLGCLVWLHLTVMRIKRLERTVEATVASRGQLVAEAAS